MLRAVACAQDRLSAHDKKLTHESEIYPIPHQQVAVKAAKIGVSLQANPLADLPNKGD